MLFATLPEHVPKSCRPCAWLRYLVSQFAPVQGTKSSTSRVRAKASLPAYGLTILASRWDAKCTCHPPHVAKIAQKQLLSQLSPVCPARFLWQPSSLRLFDFRSVNMTYFWTMKLQTQQTNLLLLASLCLATNKHKLHFYHFLLLVSLERICSPLSSRHKLTPLLQWSTCRQILPLTSLGLGHPWTMKQSVETGQLSKYRWKIISQTNRNPKELNQPQHDPAFCGARSHLSLKWQSELIPSTYIFFLSFVHTFPHKNS